MDVVMSQAPSQGRKRMRSQVVTMFKKKRKTKKSATTRTIRQPGLIVPDKLVTTMVYSGVVNYAPGLPAEDRSWNMNSIFDPDRSGVGHQPLGRDQLATFYNRYRVLSCKWEVDMIPASAAGAYALVIVPNNENAGIAGNIDTAIESPYAKYKWSQYQHTGASTGANALRLTGSMNLGKLYGVSDATLRSDDRFAAEFGASPAEIASLHVLTVDIYGNNIIYTLGVKLTYTVEVFDRIQLAAS